MLFRSNCSGGYKLPKNVIIRCLLKQGKRKTSKRIHSSTFKHPIPSLEKYNLQRKAMLVSALWESVSSVLLSVQSNSSYHLTAFTRSPLVNWTAAAEWTNAMIYSAGRWSATLPPRYHIGWIVHCCPPAAA